MIISVINHSNGVLLDEEIQRVIRAVNRQIHEDFEPYWSLGATLRLEGRGGDDPDPENPQVELRGDAIIYIWDKSDIPDAIGYHDKNYGGIPYGFVFLDIVAQLGEPWSITFSHEALELIADPEVNLLVAGPHPEKPNHEVFHWYEMCDAVQAEVYEIDGVTVSNFVLPLYFTSEAEKNGRNDFLSRIHAGKTLPSFGVNPGGYIGFYDPEVNDHVTFAPRDDPRAQARLKIRLQTKQARRAVRRAGGIPKLVAHVRPRRKSR
jgi:hypothetical protein